MFCQSCGASINQGTVFCGQCGRAQTAIPVGSPVYQVAPASTGWSGGVMTLLVIGSLLLPIVGLVAGVVGLTKPDTRGQGAALLAFSIIGWIIGFAVLASM